MKSSGWLVSTSLAGCHLLLALPAAGATIVVPSGIMATIQDGIDAARSGDTVIVADGTYPGGINFNRKLITVRSENGPQNCIIDGGDDTRGVTFSHGENSYARLDGFTIRNCRSPKGGGIHLESRSSPTIANCIIKDNNTSYSGAGINCYNSSPTIINCSISGNLAWGDGGSISCKNNSFPTITNCTIFWNTSAAKGGGIYALNSSPAIAGCSIWGNAAYGGGGGIHCHNSSPAITGCTISGNSGPSAGGIHCYNSSPAITTCTISQNEAAYQAGGIYCSDNSSPTITDCTISGNSRKYPFNDPYNFNAGGGIGLQGSSPVIANCIIWGNSTDKGGSGIFVADGSFPMIVNCTVVGNGSADNQGGGVWSADAVPTILNSILWNNSPPEIYVHNSVFWPKREPIVSYSDIEGGYQGTANINADPLFVNAAAGDFHIQPGSPCIDSASNGADMGAYEAVGSPALSSGFLLDPSDPQYIP